MTYLVTARKWRPMVFDDIVGQEHIATTLRNALASNRLSHAYIFGGPRGVGKTTTARILAKAVNCLNPKDYNPDNKCELCTEITEGRSVNVFEIDGASNRGVEEIRNLREAVRYGPAKGKYKIYIIDEVHMLTKEAFNALLKTLEEPPPYVMFIFATTEIHKVPLTILSRCQRFDFRRISIEEITSRLKLIAKEETISIDDDAFLIIAKRADGSMRDAQSIFDQVVSFCGNKIKAKQIISMWNLVDEESFFRLTDIITSKNIKDGLLFTDEIIGSGYDLKDFLNGFIEHLRNILIARSTNSTGLIESSEILKKRYESTAIRFSEIDLLRLIKIASETESAIRWSQQPRLKLEIAIVQMIKLDSSVEIGSLIRKLDNISSNEEDESENKSLSLLEHPATKLAETPIRGNVKATQPTLRADQIVTPKFIIAETPRVSEEIHLPSKRDILDKWSTFVSEAKKERIAIGTMLSETSFVDIKNDRLCISCPDDFHADNLNINRNRQYLQDLAERIYGAKVQLETILSTQNNFPVSTSHQSDQTEIKHSTRSSSQKHPVIEALIKEFGVKPINP
ncbi:MAG: DNA polymerase III subunit gamma/tau [Ignavibacteriales bacterium]|nr:DNA polymerase III subunit gamma/tau [Ignavibacteriales bacterium]